MSLSGQVDGDAVPGLAPDPAPALDPVELVVDGETFVVTQRSRSAGTYDFDWVSHPESYGFSVSREPDWSPAPDELIEQIRSFVTDVDPATGYLSD